MPIAFRPDLDSPKMSSGPPSATGSTSTVNVVQTLTNAHSYDEPSPTATPSPVPRETSTPTPFAVTPVTPNLTPPEVSSNSSQTTSTSSQPPKTHPANVQVNTRRANNAPTQPRWYIFLQSIGLKILTQLRFSCFHGLLPSTEPLKVVESPSRPTAVIRTGAHILPIIITAFIITFNAKGLLNGPEPSKSGEFALQIAAKIHELTVVGSLATIAVDIVRMYLLHDGINFGLLSAGHRFASVNYLWSTELYSIFGSKMRRRAKTFLGMTLLLCCILATTVGPASAILFLPIKVWVPAASSEFYLMGSESDLYPQKLTANHSGPEYCQIYPYKFTPPCLHSGWRALFSDAEIYGNVFHFFTFNVPSRPPRAIMGLVPVYDDPDFIETSAVGITLPLALRMLDLRNKNAIAWGYAKGRSRRLRDFVDSGGGYAFAEGKMPVIRTICSDDQIVGNKSTSRTELDFPLISRDEYWRTVVGVKPVKQGPTIRVNISALSLPKAWNGLRQLNLTHTQARGAWVSLPPIVGNSTSAGFIYVFQNETMVAARGCVVDARWANGLNLHRGSGGALEAAVGFEPLNPNGGFSFNRQTYFAEKYKPYYGPTINITKEWLDHVDLPYLAQASVGTQYVETMFETLLNASRLSMHEQGEVGQFTARVFLEYAITVFITDAISRIGYTLQTGGTDNDILLYSQPPPGHVGAESDEFLNGGPIYVRPPDPYTTFQYTTYKFGASWQFGSRGQWTAVAILSVHIIMALTHLIIATLWHPRSSSSWDTASEIVALAYNSPLEGDVLKNCSAGIAGMEPLKKIVKVVARQDGNTGEEKVELVFVTDGDYMNGRSEVVVGKGYG